MSRLGQAALLELSPATCCPRILRAALADLDLTGIALAAPIRRRRAPPGPSRSSAWAVDGPPASRTSTEETRSLSPIPTQLALVPSAARYAGVIKQRVLCACSRLRRLLVRSATRDVFCILVTGRPRHQAAAKAQPSTRTGPPAPFGNTEAPSLGRTSPPRELIRRAPLLALPAYGVRNPVWWKRLPRKLRPASHCAHHPRVCRTYGHECATQKLTILSLDARHALV